MRLLLSALVVMFSLTAQAIEERQDYNEVKVDGTELEYLRSAMDVLKQIPHIEVTDEVIGVEGRGIAFVFIDNRKLADITELWHIPASAIDYIIVNDNPGAEYGKDVRAVVKVIMEKNIADGMHLAELFRVDVTDGVIASNELGLKWKQDKLTLNGFVAWNESRKNIHKIDYTYNYDEDRKLQSGTADDYYSKSHKQQLTVRTSLDYQIANGHKISVGYNFLRIPQNYEEHTSYTRYTYLPINGEIDKSKPSEIDNNVAEKSRNYLSRHTANIGYTGFAGKWELNMAGEMYWEDGINKTIPDGPVKKYELDQMYAHTIIKAGTPLWNGFLSIGAEYNVDNLKVKRGVSVDSKNYVHTNNTNKVIAAFASLNQKIGTWNLSAGLRYERSVFTYKPYDDDYMFRVIRANITPEMIKNNPRWDHVLFVPLVTEGQLETVASRLYPTISIGTSIGESKLNISHSQGYTTPYMGLIRIELGDLVNIDERVVSTEYNYTSSIKWSWKWFTLDVMHNYYKNPVFQTTSGQININGKGYNAFDFIVNVAPKIGVWQPAIMARLHKQWNCINAANGKTLDSPFGVINWNNTVSLPDNWYIQVNGNWRSRGCEENLRYYSTNFQLDASIRKELLNNKLSLEISGENILNNSRNDFTFYGNAYTGKSQGYNSYVQRMLSFSVRYKI